MGNMIETNKTENYQITITDSNRINILKVWFMVMVVFIHSYSESINLNTGTVNFEIPYWLETLKYVISQCISRCAVPGFFMISSILLYRKPFSWKENMTKKVKTLLVPYILINSFWIVVYFICQHISKLSIYFSNENNIVSNWGIIGWLQAYGILGGYPITYPLWFIRDLFIINIFAVIIKKIIEKFGDFSALLLAVGLFANTSMVQSICFWGIGCFIVCKNIRLNMIDRINKGVLCVIYFSVIAGDVLTRGGKGNGIIHNMCIIVGIIFWFTCFTGFKRDRIIKVLLFISSYSFGIYLFHEMSLSFLQKICARLLPSSAVFQLMEYLLIPIIIVTGVLFFLVFLQKVCPRFYAVITGNRVQ